MRAARIVEPGRMEIVEIPCPEPAAGDVQIKVMASGICGT